MENIHRAAALMRTVMATEYRKYVQYVGIEFTTNNALVRYAVSSETSDDAMNRHGDALTDMFFVNVVCLSSTKRVVAKITTLTLRCGPWTSAQLYEPCAARRPTGST